MEWHLIQLKPLRTHFWWEKTKELCMRLSLVFFLPRLWASVNTQLPSTAQLPPFLKGSLHFWRAALSQKWMHILPSPLLATYHHFLLALHENDLPGKCELPWVQSCLRIQMWSGPSSARCPQSVRSPPGAPCTRNGLLYMKASSGRTKKQSLALLARWKHFQCNKGENCPWKTEQGTACRAKRSSGLHQTISPLTPQQSQVRLARVLFQAPKGWSENSLCLKGETQENWLFSIIYTPCNVMIFPEIS